MASFNERKQNGDGTYSTLTHTTGSDAIIPVDIQSRYAQTIQTHNAVNVGATTGYSTGAWIDCDGFTDIAVTLLNDAGTPSYIDIQWSHDGSTWQGTDSAIATGNASKKSVQVSIKARYGKVALGNTDATAHTMSAWAYLKS